MSAAEIGRDPQCRLLVQLGEGELRGPIDGDEEIEPALRGADLGDVNVEVAERVGLELALYALAVLDVRQPRDAVPLQAAVKRRADQTRDRRQKGVQAIVEWLLGHLSAGTKA